MESTRHPQHRLEPHGRSPGSRRSGGGQLRLFDPDGGMPRWLRLGIDAWRLAVSGDRSLVAWAAVAVEAMSARYARNERTAATVAADVRRLFRYLRAMGVTGLEGVTCDLVTRWCWAARPDRRAGCRMSARPRHANGNGSRWHASRSWLGWEHPSTRPR